MNRTITNPSNPGSQLPKEPTSERVLRNRRNLLIGASAVAGLAIFIVGNNALNGGAEDPAKFGDIDPSITSVTINPGANINHDPYVGNADNNNRISTIGGDHELTVETPEGVYLRENTNNGDWAGLTLDQIQKVDPSFVPGDDKDGVFWVNLDNDAASAEHTQSK